MSNTQDTIPVSVRLFIDRFKEDEKVFENLPEFSFIKSIAAKAKGQGCMCGLAQEMNNTINMFNSFIDTIDSNLALKVGNYFGLSKVCFAIQSQESFAIRCFN